MAITPTPPVPSIEAGQVIDAAVMNAINTAASFYMSKPLTVAVTSGSVPASGSSSRAWTPMTVTSVAVDADGMYSSGAAYLTVQRPGYYACTYNTSTLNQNDILVSAGLRFQAGASNPYQASGQDIYGGVGWIWYRSGIASIGHTMQCRGGGVTPGYMYPGDHISLQVCSSVAFTSNGALVVQWIGA